MYCSQRYITTSILALALATPAMAEITPRQVWDSFGAYLEASGYTVEAQEAEADGTLTVSDIVMRMEWPAEAGTTVVRLSQLKLRDLGDGSVALVCDQALRFEVDAAMPDRPADNMIFDLDCSQIDTRISGDPDAYTMTYAGPQASMKLVALNSVEAEGEIKELTLAASGLDGKTDYAVRDGYQTRQVLTADSVSYVVRFLEPEDDSTMALNATASDLAFEGDMSLPQISDMASPSQLLGAMTLDGAYRIGRSETTYATGGNAPAMAAQISAAEGSGRIGVVDGQMALEGTSKEVLLQVTEGAPVPFDLQIADTAMNLQMPMVASDTARDFGLGLALREAKLADVVWSLFDPQAKLPRDPMNVELDLGGKARVLVDPTDPDAMAEAEMAGMPPGQVDNLSLKTLRIGLAGAELTGSGEVDLDYAAAEAQNGMPVPDGQLNLKLVGGNGLLDNLVAAGLLPEQQALTARMMMGLFARPGTGGDEMVSEIEFHPDGRILANGQQLK